MQVKLHEGPQEKGAVAKVPRFLVSARGLVVPFSGSGAQVGCGTVAAGVGTLRLGRTDRRTNVLRVGHGTQVCRARDRQ